MEGKRGEGEWERNRKSRRVRMEKKRQRKKGGGKRREREGGLKKGSRENYSLDGSGLGSKGRR